MRKFRIRSLRRNTKGEEAVCNVANTDEKVHERHLKYWIIKVLVLTLASLTVFTVLTFLYSSVTNKSSIKESTIGLFIQTLMEIIKFVLT